MRLVLFAFGCLTYAAAAAADQAQPYAGQQHRAVSSYSEREVAALLAGEGRGMARPAELNGYPGPSHLLDMQEELELSGEQIAVIRAAFERMQLKARDLGARLVEAEAELDALFRDRRADPDTLVVALRKAADLRMELRETHLRAHLEVTPLLTAHQREAYALLRGYGAGHGKHGRH
ncbi:Spy/CpxP family protein refolding chaperone [Minwuia thermotolerans]|uniref:Periplasmic heavy metal sensor n=1 Tax=Minwuia thermotolerans TaxID=2056226 RepID=A0A2M9FVT3_9PROT|nr:hypothetical protein [Minwuia thermotolerans]PJK27585.1 hypothetical protein CVT23_21995 [Minwuia thermotolerans]